MTTSSTTTQVPPPGATVIDHLAHFVPDRMRCEHGLRALGFDPTPFSLQYHRLAEGDPLVAAGTGNYCVMLRQGYLEFLAPVSDTPVAQRLKSAIARYVGVHSIVFGSADARADHARLRDSGFAALDPIDLQRDVETPDGIATARFTVVRVAPEAMAEGRIQFCQHHTEHAVWQSRWLTHPNAAIGLKGAIVCVDDVEEAGRRFAQFVGRPCDRSADRCRIETHCGFVDIFDARGLRAEYGLDAPTLPWIAGSVLSSADIARTKRAIAASAGVGYDAARSRLIAHGGEAIGGIFVFVAA